MTYLIVIAVALIVFILLFRLIKFIFLKIIKFIKSYPYFVVSVVLIGCAASFRNVQVAVKVAVLTIVIKIICVIIEAIKRASIPGHERKLLKYLNRNYSASGYINVADIKITESFRRMEYPDGKSYGTIVADFLKMQTERAHEKLIELVYERIGEVEIETYSKIESFSKKHFKYVTYSIPYQDMFQASVKWLEENKLIQWYQGESDQGTLKLPGANINEEIIDSEDIPL